MVRRRARAIATVLTAVRPARVVRPRRRRGRRYLLVWRGRFVRCGDEPDDDGLALARLGHACDVAVPMGPAGASFRAPRMKCEAAKEEWRVFERGFDCMSYTKGVVTWALAYDSSKPPPTPEREAAKLHLEASQDRSHLGFNILSIRRPCSMVSLRLHP